MIDTFRIRAEDSAPSTLLVAVMASGAIVVLAWIAAPLCRTLYAKTFLILGSQLAVTWIFAYAVIAYVRHRYAAGDRAITASESAYGELDLEVDWSSVRRYVLVFTVLDVGSFLLLLLTGRANLLLGIPLFTLWSILTGVSVATVLLRVDENLGTRVIGLITVLTLGAAALGTYSPFYASTLEKGLLIGLLLLLVAMAVRLFFSISVWKQRLISLSGALLFVVYLLIDFVRLGQLSETPGANSWPVAMDLAIGIYLDVINLTLYLLDLLSD